MSPTRYTASTINDNALDALYANASKGWRRGDIWKAKAEEIEADRDRLAAELEQLRTVLKYEHKRANDAIDREETAEQASEEQRRRADLAEGDVRTLRAGLRANGADPTQIQNLWAQLRLRNRQWREAKQRAENFEGRAKAYEQRAAQAEAAITRARAVAGWAVQGWSDLSPQKVLAALDGTDGLEVITDRDTLNEPEPRPISLGTACAGCGHARNWHVPGPTCQVTYSGHPCGCTTFQPPSTP
ncbi:hypothetical protein ACWEQ7_22140 [Streptomyces sp. NPDC004069]